MASRKRDYDDYSDRRSSHHHHPSQSSASRRGEERAAASGGGLPPPAKGPRRDHRDRHPYSERSPRRDPRDYQHHHHHQSSHYHSSRREGDRRSDSRRRDDRSPPHRAPRRAYVEEGLPYEETPQSSSAAATAAAVEDTPPNIDLDALLDESRSEPDAEAILAEKRRKRAEIMAKYNNHNLPASASSTAATNSPLATGSPAPPTPAAGVPTADASRQGTDSPDPTQTPAAAAAEPNAKTDATFDLTKHNEAPTASTQAQLDAEHEISAASYNPDEDRKQDALRQLMHQAGDPSAHNGTANGAEGGAAHNHEEEDTIEIEVTDDEADEGAQQSDEDDMFAMALDEKEKKDKPKKTKKIRVKKGHGAAEKLQATGMVVIDRRAEASLDDADDSEGYYRVILGELLDSGRYHVHSNLGKGMFSSVVRAKDTQQGGREVAIKMIRSQETMYKAGQKEVQILNKLNEADPLDKKHMIRLLRTFEHRNHLCLVFESMALNLREVVKRYGKDVGLNLKAVRAYAHQMFLGLSLMKKCNLMHADLKPDNVLVTENNSQLKISDLGSASDTSENDITPYLVSRFYRAPEIILGLPYDTALDMWSIGCTLYELYTGKILFPGRNNNQMLLHIQELKGRFSNKFMKKARFADQHFDGLGNFVTTEINKSSNTESVVKLSLPNNPKHDLKSRLAPQAQLKRMAPDEARALTLFVDLLDRALETDPAKRLTPKDALNHPFLR